MNELSTDASLVGKLIAAQFPQLSHLPLKPIETDFSRSSSNTMSTIEVG